MFACSVSQAQKHSDITALHQQIKAAPGAAPPATISGARSQESADNTASVVTPVALTEPEASSQPTPAVATEAAPDPTSVEVTSASPPPVALAAVTAPGAPAVPGNVRPPVTSTPGITQPSPPAIPIQESAPSTLPGGTTSSTPATPPGQHPTATVGSYLQRSMVNELGQAVQPADVLAGGDDLYFLGPNTVWKLPGGALQMPESIKLSSLTPPGGKVGNVPVQEFLSFTWFPAHRSIVVLDKSGSLFELVGNRWQLMRANFPIGSPDPHYISVAAAGDHVLLLDPERNQIWRVPGSKHGARYFRDVMPWRIKAGDPNVTNGISMAFDGATYVARRNGAITRYPADAHGGNGGGHSVWRVPHGLRPSRFATAHGAPLYLIERENNRIIEINKANGAHTFFNFPAESNLRGVLPTADGFWVISSSQLVFRPSNTSNKIKEGLATRRIDDRLAGLIIPVPGASLPGHTGVYPGARRAYRYGVHAGLDFFADPGRGTHVTMNTPAVAAEAGKIIRADVRYKDMDARRYSSVMSNCAHEHYCSESNEDLFRGCQVWIDHGNGLITRYAHLNSARPDLTPGKLVGRGETIGYIGVSGTGENLPGRVKHPHLHFEIWLDDHYLGWGLNLAETMALYENVFGRAQAKRGSKL